MNAAGLDLLKNYEGFSPTAYRDIAGIWTIGFGFTEGVKPGDAMTMDDALVRLDAELAPREAQITEMCTQPATDNQHAAMTCLAYNVGINNFRGSTVLRMHNAGNTEAAADAFLLWDKAGGKVVPGLIRRRHSERALYLTA